MFKDLNNYILLLLTQECARWFSRYNDWTTGWTVRGSNPGGGEFFRTCPDRPWGPLYNGYRVFPGGEVRPERAADHSPPSSVVVMEE
jgi:hypothetical protein